MINHPMTSGAHLEAMPKKPEALDVDRRPGRPRARLVQGVLLGLAVVGLIFAGFVRAAEESAHRAEADWAQATEASPPKNERHGQEENEAAQRTKFKTDWPAGKRFRDFEDGPELQVAETDGPSDRALAFSDAITDAEWEKCVIGGGCKTVKIVGLVVSRPVRDQLDYVSWISKESDRAYWLMNRAEYCHRSAKCDFAGRASWWMMPFQWHRMTPPSWDGMKFKSVPYVGPPPDVHVPSHMIDAALERLRKERGAFHVARWLRRGE